MRVVCIWIGLLALFYGAIEYELYWIWFILLLIVLAAFSRAHRMAESDKTTMEGEKE